MPRVIKATACTSRKTARMESKRGDGSRGGDGDTLLHLLLFSPRMHPPSGFLPLSENSKTRQAFWKEQAKALRPCVLFVCVCV